MHSGVDTWRYLMMNASGLVFPATAGLLLFGWRSLGVLLPTMGTAAIAAIAWRRIGTRGAQLEMPLVLWLSGLLALMLPAHLFGGKDPATGLALWPIPPTAGVLLVIILWMTLGLGAGKVHPVVLTYILLALMFGTMLIPHESLQKGRIFWGDLLDAGAVRGTIVQPWFAAEKMPDHDATRTDPASQTLREFTSGARLAERARVSMDVLLRDWMPPLEDLLVGGHPSPIGLASGIAVIIGGLFLLYRGAIDARVPLIMMVTTGATILMLPVPLVVPGSDMAWRVLSFQGPEVGWELRVTLVSYELLAGPLLFTAFFLAASPLVRPIARRARVIYAILLGIVTGIMQIYVSVAMGAYLAVLMVGILSPAIDRFFKPRTLV